MPGRSRYKIRSMQKNMPADQFGPEYVVTIRDPQLDLTGFLVIHNTALGLGKGGIRMTADVSEEEIRRLATVMTWKNSLAGIPFGGAKAGLRWTGGSEARKKELVQSFARALKPFLIKKYIAGPDVQSGEKEMQWFAEAAGRWQTATGKPKHYCIATATGKRCGIPHEFGSTGFGVAHAARVAANVMGLDIHGAEVAIHGFGNVGTFAFQYLAGLGAKITVLADHAGAVHVPQGFDPRIVAKLIEKRQPIARYPRGKKVKSADFWKIPTDILIPASVTDVINDGNKKMIRTKLIVEGGNIPMREKIEEEFFRQGVVVVPDFVANAGGVISSYAEYRGYSPAKMFKLVEERIVRATAAVMRRALAKKENPRKVAMDLARARVEKAMAKRRQTFS